MTVKPNRWDSLRAPTTSRPRSPEINRLIREMFATSTGRTVLQHLWDQHVTSQLPIGASECAYREAEGRKRLVLDLVRIVEEPDRVPDGPSSTTGNDSARRTG